MPPLLRALYEHLRDSGAYEADWIDRACWRAFWAFVVVLLIFG
jgi:hypothetical protein